MTRWGRFVSAHKACVGKELLKELRRQLKLKNQYGRLLWLLYGFFQAAGM
jgi:hypothetical protein